MKDVTLGAAIMLCLVALGTMGSGQIVAGLFLLVVGVILFIDANKPEKSKEPTDHEKYLKSRKEEEKDVRYWNDSF